MSHIIPANFDPFADRNYDLTITEAESFALRDAITCLAHIAAGGDPGLYRDYETYGFLSDGLVLADRVTALTRPTARAVGRYFENLADAQQRQN